MSAEEMKDFKDGVVISDEVVSVISAIAAKSVEGVNGMQTGVTGGIVEFLGKKNPSKGVKVVVTDEVVDVDISISVTYGCRIQQVAKEIQEKVKSEIESMTGYSVNSVNVLIDDVVVPKEEKDAAKKIK
ncbi:MAG: Asp23/Gls24 family envelope stress response protein [Ruminococcaceae bacterium]|nr:Asp23/Gls24 family envelope stress response protein [Oscillospiraceae bacterium]